MDARLKDILTKLKIEKTHLTYFETGKFTDLSFNKEKRIYNITLTLDEPLPAFVYVSTLEAFTNYLKQNDERVLVALYIKLTKPCYDCKTVKDYITFYVDSKEKNPEDYAFFKEQSMSIKNNLIKITYSSSLMEECLNLLKVKLERFLSAAGFSYLTIDYIYIEPEDTIFDYE